MGSMEKISIIYDLEPIVIKGLQELQPHFGSYYYVVSCLCNDF